MGSERAERESAPPFSPVKELFSQLRSSFFDTEFQRMEQMMVEHEEHMKEKFAGLEKKTESLEKKKHFLFSENQKLKEELVEKQKESDALRKENLEYCDQIKVLNRKVSRKDEVDDELKKKQREIDEMKKVNGEYERREAEFRVYKKHFLDLGGRVLELEKTAKEFLGSDETPLISLKNSQQKNRDSESSKPPLFGKKVDPAKRTEPKFEEIIQIDDDDDDDDDQKCISTLKRKRVSYEIKQESNDDQPVACSVGSKSCLTKVDRKHDLKSLSDINSESDSGSDDENVDEVYKSIIARKKSQKKVKEKE